MSTTAPEAADWHQRVVSRSLKSATQKSIDRGANLVRAAAVVLNRSGGDDITVQEVAAEAGQSLRTLYQYFESKDDLLLAVFEEAMRTYARLIREAIEGLTDPRERLAGALLAALLLPERTEGGIARGLSRLRLQLTHVEPELVRRSEAPVAALLGELVEAAAADGSVRVDDPETATFLVLALNTAAITTATFANGDGKHPPSSVDVVTFCLLGLGAQVDTKWLARVQRRLNLPKEPA